MLLFHFYYTFLKSRSPKTRKAFLIYLHALIKISFLVPPRKFVTFINCETPLSHPLHMFMKQCLITHGDFTYVCMYEWSNRLRPYKRQFGSCSEPRTGQVHPD